MKSLAVLAAIAAVALLSGCTAGAQAAAPPSPSGNAIDQSLLMDSYHVEGGGQYVQGSRDMCDLLASETILIEDQKSLDHYDGTTSVTSITLQGGQFDYSTIWPNEVVATGVANGHGTYTINSDASGRPISITGHATITWHDKASNTNSQRTDDIDLTLTKIDRPKYCTG